MLPGRGTVRPQSTLVVDFRKRITAEMFMEANECLLAHKDGKGGDGMPPSPRPDRPEEEENQGTLVLDVACVPVDIRYPQDVSLLNEAGEKLETIICRFCKAYGLALPRRYKRKARKNYLNFAKAKEHTDRKSVV